MSRKAQFDPGWLVSLMCQWAVREWQGLHGALGFPRKSAGFSEKTTGGYNHSNPTALSFKDFRDLQDSLEGLRMAHVDLWAAMMMYYQPWVVEAFKEQGYPFENSSYYHRLHRAHRLLADMIDATNIPDIKVVDELIDVGIK